MTAEITLRSRENDVANRLLDDNRVTFCLRGILPFPGSTVAQKPFHLDHRVPELNGIAANYRFKLPGFEFHPVNCLYGWEVWVQRFTLVDLLALLRIVLTFERPPRGIRG
jgi:hypothetical protein